jgi:hypothetical protein
VSVFSVSPFDVTFSVRLDEVSGTLLYVGEAALGASPASPVWRIRKLVTSGTVLSVLWANGDQSFNNIWDNRASLSYS